MCQYFNDPEATRQAFRGVYFNSGDLAVMHPDGAIAIMDRSKDIIISGGEVRNHPLLANPASVISLRISECIKPGYRTRSVNLPLYLYEISQGVRSRTC